MHVYTYVLSTLLQVGMTFCAPGDWEAVATQLVFLLSCWTHSIMHDNNKKKSGEAFIFCYGDGQRFVLRGKIDLGQDKDGPISYWHQTT